MWTRIAIPAGTYAATVYEVKLPEELESQWLLDRAGPAAVRISNVMGVIVVAIVLVALGALFGLAFMPWAVWFAVLGLLVALIVLAWALSRTTGYRAVADARTDFERTYPAYVLRLV